MVVEGRTEAAAERLAALRIPGENNGTGSLGIIVEDRGGGCGCVDSSLVDNQALVVDDVARRARVGDEGEWSIGGDSECMKRPVDRDAWREDGEATPA